MGQDVKQTEPTAEAKMQTRHLIVKIKRACRWAVVTLMKQYGACNVRFLIPLECQLVAATLIMCPVIPTAYLLIFQPQDRMINRKLKPIVFGPEVGYGERRN